MSDPASTPEQSSPYDLCVIGGGPGGYVAAIRAAQLGFKTALIDKRDRLGGTCLNVGCIPSKALLQSSEYFHMAGHDLASHGVVTTPKLDLSAMMGRKNGIVDDLTKGIDFLCKKNKIDRFTARAQITSPTQIDLHDGPDGGKSLNTQRILVATGSEPTSLPGITIDEDSIVSSTGALSFSSVPKHIVVVGAGVIGLELGSVWNRLGAKVTVVEFLDRILPGMDAEIAKNYHRILQKQGLEFQLGHKIISLEKSGKSVKALYAPANGPTQGDSDPKELKADKVLVAVGRRPYADGLGLDQLGITPDPRGFIPVDEDFKTSVDGIYAIGDCVPGPMLAHKAEEEGVVAVERMAGLRPSLDHHLIPGVVYCFPELASVGAHSEELKEAGRDFKTGKFSMTANSRGKAMGFTQGMVKVLADAQTDRLLGCHIIAPAAGDMIHEAAALMAFGGSAEDMARLCHAHPTYSEAIKEAALAADGRAIHS